MTKKPGERRRGAALEAALLQAAWDELVAVGYARFTIEGVVARAGTSRPVIYRRWANRRDLVLAALRARYGEVTVDVPETGNLRDEVIALLVGASRSRAEAVAIFTLDMGEFFAEERMAFADLRQELLGRRRSKLDDILDRAIARGEIDPSALTPRIRTLPIDLMRHEVLMTLKPIPRETVEQIVDEIFLPLVRGRGGRRFRNDDRDAGLPC